MYRHCDGNDPYSYSTEFLGHFPLVDTTMAQPTYPTSSLPPLTSLAIPGDEYDSISPLKSELGQSSSGGSSYVGSPSSITSYGTYSPTLLQRSTSSHSLLQKTFEGYSALTIASPQGFFDLETSSVRKALSTGDLQGINLGQYNQRSNSPLSNESSIIESMSKACRYSPEEKKERIERYRSKRNLRNFNKKIKYECRKTLADSRPRIRGRFARNDEIEKMPESQWGQAGLEEFDEDDDNWISFLQAFSNASNFM